MTIDEQVEIVARELYVRRWASYGQCHQYADHYAQARRVREGWYRKLNNERRERWRLEARLFIESLAASGLSITTKTETEA